MIKTFTLFSLLFIVFIFTFTSEITYSQSVTTAAINGSIVDQNGDALPAATILITHRPSGTQYGTTSRADGKFNIAGLRVGGPYSVTVTFVGYKSQSSDEIYLQLSQNKEINFTLVSEAIELETINVTSDRTAIISSDRTGASTNVTTEQIENFPTISRSFQDFQKFNPQSSGNSSSSAGRNNKFNNIQIDGTQYNDLFGLGASGTPGGQAFANPISLDAIQEFQVVIAPYDVRLSGFTGGGINAITRSGTNQFSGSAFGYYRNESLVGKSPDEKRTKFNKFTEYQTGFRLGGPVIKDKLFFFLNGELTKRNEPKENIALTQLTNIKVDSLAQRMKNALINRYGYDPGSFDVFDAERPSTKLFARLDYNFSEDHQITLRHNFVDASDDIIPRTTAAFLFEDRLYIFNSKTNSSVLQLNSRFGNKAANELIIGYTSIRDEREVPSKSFPTVEVQTTQPGFTLLAGTENFSIANVLDQDIIEFTDNFSLYFGDHIVTLGTHNEFFTFKNLFIRDVYGNYRFSNMTDLDSGKANRYRLSYSLTSDPQQAAKFSALQFGFYAQDEWRVDDGFKLTFGLRLDVPTFPDKPVQNDSIIKYFSALDISTSKVPTGNLLFSPRFGFNWDVMRDRKTQIRGGLGVFTGRVPYVWISNQYGNTGVEFGRVELTGAAAPRFITDPFNQPKPGVTPGINPVKTTEVNLTADNFKMPQVFRMNAGLDQELPYGLTGTLEVIYSKSLNDILYQDINISPATGTFADGRPVFTKRVSSNFTNVILLKNTSEGYQFNVSGQVQGKLPYGLYTNFGYTWGRAKDQNSGLSSQAISQWRFNPIPGDPNNPPLTTSSFEIQHRVFAALSYALEFYPKWRSTFSVIYGGQSGRPFAYTYDGDVNADGQTSNDMLFVPKDKSQIFLGTINSTTKVSTEAPQSNYDALFKYIENDEYMKEGKGKILERNGGREPWIDQLDFRFAQEIPLFGTHELLISLDILNVLNLIDGDLGWVEQVPNQNDSVIKYEGKDNTGKNVFSFKDKQNPFEKDNILSRWQMQLGARYAF